MPKASSLNLVRLASDSKRLRICDSSKINFSPHASYRFWLLEHCDASVMLECFTFYNPRDGKKSHWAESKKTTANNNLFFYLRIKWVGMISEKSDSFMKDERKTFLPINRTERELKGPKALRRQKSCGSCNLKYNKRMSFVLSNVFYSFARSPTSLSQLEATSFQPIPEANLSR